MFGDRSPDEMVPSKSFSSWVRSFRPESAKQASTDEIPFDGSYRRVPALDNIALPREIGATVKVNANGEPLDEANTRLMELQNSESEKARRNVNEDYTVVYLPPHFRERVILFVLSLWMVATLVFVTALALPIHLGRAVFWTILGREVHDGYSIVVGFYLLWGCYFFGKTLDRIDKQRQRSDSDEPRGDMSVYLFKYTILWIGKLAYVGFWMGIIIPILIALVVELYLVHPLRLIINPELTLNIRIVDSWAIGLLYTKLIFIVRRRLVRTTLLDLAIERVSDASTLDRVVLNSKSIFQIRDYGLKGLDVGDLTLHVIAPVTSGLLACLVLPIIIVLPLQRLLPNYISQIALCQSPLPASSDKPLMSGMVYLLNVCCPSRAVLYVYPGLFVVAGIVKLYDALQIVAESWAQQIRDSEFLLERRLRNLDPPESKPKLPSMRTTPSSSTISIDQQDN